MPQSLPTGPNYWPDAVARQASVLAEQSREIERLNAGFVRMLQINVERGQEIKRLRAQLADALAEIRRLNSQAATSHEPEVEPTALNAAPTFSS